MAYGEHPHESRVRRVGRWLVCVPAGLLAGFVVVLIMAGLSGRYIDDSLGGAVMLVLANAAGSAFAVMVACRIAPSHERQLAIGLSILSVLCLVAAAVPIIALGEWLYLLCGIASASGAIWVTVTGNYKGF